MRITHSMLHQSALNGMQANLRRLDDTQRQATTMRRVNRPEDDPHAMEQALGYRAQIEGGEVRLNNISLSLDWLGASERSLQALSDHVGRADALSLRGANETLSADERKGLVAEMNGILEEAVSSANTRHANRYLFSGFQTDTAPFAVTRDPLTDQITAVSYNGDNGQITREVESGIEMTVNTPGDPLITDLLDGMIALRDALQADPFVAADVTNAMSSLRDDGDGVLEAQATIGTKMRRLGSTADRTELAQIQLETLRSEAEDADMAEVLTRLSHQQFAYESSLQVNGKTLQRSLLDFLG